MTILTVTTGVTAFAPSLYQRHGTSESGIPESPRFPTSTVQSTNSVLNLSSASLMESQPKSFEERMREMVNGGRKKSTGSTTVDNESKLPTNVKIVKTLEEYRRVVGGERDRIVVVRFFAPWCKVRCLYSQKPRDRRRRFLVEVCILQNRVLSSKSKVNSTLILRLVRLVFLLRGSPFSYLYFQACKAVAPLFYRMANSRPEVLFIEVPVSDTNANLHQGLQVPSLPYGHIYHPSGGLVEEDRIARKFFPQFAHKVQSYVNGSCDLVDGECHSPYVDVPDAAEEKDQPMGRRASVEL